MDAAVSFGVLGPLDVRVAGRPVPVTAQREIVVLTALLARPGETVPTERLAEMVWPDAELPAKPANQIAICVLSLRRRLARAGAPDGLLVTRAPGYLVRADGVRLDTADVERAVAAATALEADGRRPEALTRLRGALSCWRGPVFGGARCGWLATEAVRWSERRAALLDRCLQLELDLGGHRGVIGELSVLVAGQGLRERPREQLMIALCRAGRPAQALSVYRVTCRMLREQLGIEPSARLRRVRDAIADGDLPAAVRADGAAIRRGAPAAVSSWD